MKGKSHIEGKTCAKCDKGKLSRIYDQIEPGFFAEGFKCGNCGEIWLDEGIMRKVEEFRRRNAEERHIVQVGSSLAVPIPASYVRKLNLKAKDLVFVSEKEGELLIKTKPI